MPKTSAEVDQYIENAPEFAKPILKKIRKAYHKAEPEIVETIKWRFPFFEHEGIVGNMAAFKAHVTYGFWKGALMDEATRVKISDVSDLPSEAELVAQIREAVRLNKDGVKVERKPKAPAKEVETPDDLTAALKKNPAARKAFDAFPPSHRREYIRWIVEAKQEATRAKRLAQAIEWMAEGKPRNWKYMK